ncbi:MAG: hypothetical protein SFU53_06790 [Terrimicrobiaceae bacterium]|nr:hypothetical protein [Terrimicrobiaceae bacterium]
MSSPQKAILGPQTAMICQATCEPASVLPGETAIIRAEVFGTAELPSQIAMLVRSSQLEIVAEGALVRTNETEPFRYSGSWSPAEELDPGAYDILLGLPGGERRKLIRITLLSSSVAANLKHLQQALHFRTQARFEIEAGHESEAAALLEEAIAAYESASQPAAAAEAMLDAANLYVNLNQRPQAIALYERALGIREAGDDHDGVAYCRRKLKGLTARSVGAD